MRERKEKKKGVEQLKLQLQKYTDALTFLYLQLLDGPLMSIPWLPA